MLCKYYIYYSSLWQYVHNENNKGVAIIVCLCKMKIITEEQSVVIINLRKLIKEIDGRFEWYG